MLPLCTTALQRWLHDVAGQRFSRTEVAIGAHRVCGLCMQTVHMPAGLVTPVRCLSGAMRCYRQHGTHWFTRNWESTRGHL